MHGRRTVPLGNARCLLLHVALALRVIHGSLFTSSDSSSSSNSVTFPNCRGLVSYNGDGFCDHENNNAECGYDGGDCCACSCLLSSSSCGGFGFDCLDPEVVGDPILGCEVPPIEPPAVSPCVAGTPRHWVVNTTAGANALGDSILCSGGIFEVEWKGYVSINRTLYAIDGTTLTVVGTSNAVADGGGRTQLFAAFGGSLNVSDMEMTNGSGFHGGAISATQQSEVTLTRVNFSSNTAEGFGGAIRLDNSSLDLVGSSTFTGNSAVFGGAIYVARRSTFVHHVGSGEIYRFIDNTAMDGGALYVTGSSSCAEYTGQHSASDSSHVSSYSGAAYSTSSSYGNVNGFASNLYTPDFNYSADNSSAVGATFAKTWFINNTVQRSGGAVYMGDSSDWSWVGETIFEGNSAVYGGALFMAHDSSVHWQGVTLFARNRARQDGGAVASAFDVWFPSAFWDGTVSFRDNSCGANGGALALFGEVDLCWGDTTPTAPVFSGNSAGLFGGAIYTSEATYGQQFNNAWFTENHAQDGGAVFAAGTGTAQVVVSSQESILYQTTFSNCKFIGNTAQEAGGAIEIAVGRAQVDNTVFSGNVASVGGALKLFGTIELFNSTFSDNKSGEGGGPAISSAGPISEMSGLNFSANNFLCANTEFLDYNEGNASKFAAICQGCDTPCNGCIIEDNTSVPTCTTLIDHAKSGTVTTTIKGVIVEAGYWRASSQSRNVLSCFNANACLGGLTGDPGFCRSGYEGPYCSLCSEGYAPTLAFRCSQCAGESVAVLVVILGIAFIAALVFVWHMVSIEPERATGGVVASAEKVLPLQSMKIVVVAWQIVTQFTSVAHVIYPDTYQRLLDVVAWVNFDIGWMLSAGCMMDVDFHDRLLVATVGPIVVIALLGITFKAAIHRNRASEVALRVVRRKHLGTAVLVTFFIYSSVSSAVFRTFACDKFDDGRVYLRTDYRIECDSPRHKAFMIYAGVMIVVYPVGIPLFYAIMLFLERKILVQGPDNEAPWYDSTSALRQPYRPSVFYYEVVECSRRVLLTGAVVFIYPNTAAQIAVTMVVAFTFVLVSEVLRPYNSRWDTWVSRAGHVIVFLNLYVALLLKVDISSKHQHDQGIFAGILVGAHATMILLVIVETIVLFGSLRNQERSMPVPHPLSAASVRGSPASAEC